jgi:ATP/maltotriose-dependent transcriptional regulator MalT
MGRRDLGADRGRARASRGRAGHGRDSRALGVRGPLQRSRPLPGGGVGGPTRHLEHLRVLGVRLGAARPRRGGRTRRRYRTARDALKRLEETTQPSGTDVALGIEARSRALLTNGDNADLLYREAIDRLGRTQLRPELARAQLLYGEWLRREGRRGDAREQLRTAHDLFASIGMEAFAERARRELLATGEQVRKRSPETREELTAQEEQIGRLARDGLSNPEIGGQLFLSARTVEWHLRKVFTKLHISSRRQLRIALPEVGRPLAP